jgi:6-phosphogluconolactonase (cycloisomerase 2 family)
MSGSVLSCRSPQLRTAQTPKFADKRHERRACAGANPSAVTIDPSGQFAYVPNAGSNNVSAYAINGTTGALTAVAGSPFAAGSDPTVIYFASAVGEEFAYVANAGSNNVSAYAVNTTTGALTAVAGSPFAAGANPYSVTLPIDSFNPWAY